MHKVIMHQGKRPSMEDKVAIVENFHENYSLFVVCDGHGGDFVANYCVTNLGGVLKNHLRSGQDMETALKNTFSDLDDGLSIPDSYMTGTTCIVILKNTDHIWVANCGDSRAIMNRNKMVIPLSRDHKPVGDEKHRIEELGGDVFYMDVPRVNGELAVSRAIGDKRFRPYVIPTPDVVQYNFAPENKFIVMATDGLWDILKSSVVNRMIHNRYVAADVRLTDNQLVETCASMLDGEIINNIVDNTTIIIIHIRR